MYKMIALYRKPADEAGFRRHYEAVHLPLVRQLPGLRGLVVGWGRSPPWGGDPEYHLVAEMEFDDAAAFAAAAESPQMRAVGKDARVFAGDIMSLATVATD
jgi:uncharacterized protein (TIGR02118 family)